MAEQEKKQEQLSYEERLAKAIESLKGTPLSTDTGMFAGNMTRGALKRFGKK